jgi:hypothetical protein
MKLEKVRKGIEAPVSLGRKWMLAIAGLCFFMPIIWSIVSGNIYFYINDDGAIMSLLRSGDAHVLILGYPLSALMVKLYAVLPLIPWYSIVMIALASVSAILFFHAWAAFLPHERPLLWITIFFAGAAYFYYLFNHLNLAIITITFFATAFLPLLLKNKKGFVFSVSLLVIALSLRDFNTILLPFAFLLIGFLGVSKKLPVPGIGRPFHPLVFILLLLFVPVVGNYLAYSTDEYKEWTKFNLARSIQIDYSTYAPHATLASGIKQEDLDIFRLWYPYDEQTVPSKNLVALSGSIGSVFLKAVMNTNYSRFFINNLRYYGKFLGFLFFLILLYLLTYRERRGLFVLFNLSIACLVVAVLLVRNVDRVSWGLLFFWLVSLLMIMVLFDDMSIRPASKGQLWRFPVWSLCFAFLLAIAVPVEAYKANYRDNSVNKARLEQYRVFRHGQENATIVPAIYFPCALSDGGFVFPLFRENDMIGDFQSQNFIPAGWLARHPSVNRKLAAVGVKDFYSLIIDGNTLFFGGASMDPELNKLYLSYLDRNFGDNGRFKHSLEVIKSDEHFSYVRVVRKER